MNRNSLENLLSACHLDFSRESSVSRLGWRFYLVIGTLGIPKAVKVHCLVRAIAYDHFTTSMTEFCVKNGNLDHLESNAPCGGVMSLAEAPRIARELLSARWQFIQTRKNDDSPVNVVMSDNSRDYVISARKILGCRRVSDFLHATRQLASRDSDLCRLSFVFFFPH